MAKARDSTAEQSPENEETDAAPGLGQFEASVAELEALVEALESGDIPLEDALGKFERGVRLSRQCQTLLKSAELRVDQLLAEGDNERVETFDTPPEDTPN